uniref:Uncharacterized protein n=1 Tax=Anguilla anguilla TaxID=7936 RepID=A0A0E9R8Q9_ANGAN
MSKYKCTYYTNNKGTILATSRTLGGRLPAAFQRNGQSDPNSTLHCYESLQHRENATS